MTKASTPSKTRSSPRTTNGNPSRAPRRPPWLVQAQIVAAVWGVVVLCIGLQYAINSAWSVEVMQSSCAVLRDGPATPRLSSILASAAYNASTRRPTHERRANPSMGIYPKYDISFMCCANNKTVVIMMCQRTWLIDHCCCSILWHGCSILWHCSVFPRGCKWRDVSYKGKKGAFWDVVEYEYWDDRSHRWTTVQPPACRMHRETKPKGYGCNGHQRAHQPPYYVCKTSAHIAAYISAHTVFSTHNHWSPGTSGMRTVLAPRPNATTRTASTTTFGTTTVAFTCWSMAVLKWCERWGGGRVGRSVLCIDQVDVCVCVFSTGVVFCVFYLCFVCVFTVSHAACSPHRLAGH